MDGCACLWRAVEELLRLWQGPARSIAAAVATRATALAAALTAAAAAAAAAAIPVTAEPAT